MLLDSKVIEESRVVVYVYAAKFVYVYVKFIANTA